MNKQKLFMIVASSAGLVSVFLPWKKAVLLVLDMSVNGLQYLEGILVLTMFGGVLALCLMGSQKAKFTNMYKIAIGTAGILAAVVAVSKMMSLRSEFGKITDFTELAQVPDNAIANMAKVSIGSGLYLCIVAGIALAAIAMFVKTPAEFSVADSKVEVVESEKKS